MIRQRKKEAHIWEYGVKRMRIDISSIKEDKPVKIVLLMEHRHINLVFFYKINKKTNKSYIEVKQLYYAYNGLNYIDKSIIEVEYHKTGFGYMKFFYYIISARR